MRQVTSDAHDLLGIWQIIKGIGRTEHYKHGDAHGCDASQKIDLHCFAAIILGDVGYVNLTGGKRLHKGSYDKSGNRKNENPGNRKMAIDTRTYTGSYGEATSEFYVLPSQFM
jgi:hypothetical protein